jgi:endonuclease-3
MKREERYKAVLDYFAQQMPEVTTELEFGSVFQLLVAVILSAQCTDKRVNMVTPELFGRFPDAASMAAAEADEVYEYVKSVSYPNSKAKHLVEMARALVSDHGGEVPADMDALLKLPGVGRKTANVIQAVAFGRSTMAVDTHVYRVSHRLGLVSKRDNTPLKVEQALMANIPDEQIPLAHHWLLLHGRYVCTSQRPKCAKCELAAVCPKLLEGSKLE